MDNIVLITGIISNVFVSIGVVVAIFQLYKMKESNEIQTKTMLADHERRKKQSTLEFYSQIYPTLSEIRTRIKDTFGNEIINPDDPKYKNNTDLKNQIYEYLVIIERFAVGINSGVYDINIFIFTSGIVVSGMYKKLELVIERMRITENYPDMFCSFEKMSKEIERINNNEYLNKSEEEFIGIKHINCN